MEFEEAMRQASEYLIFEPRFLDPGFPQGLWFCDSAEDVAVIQTNAVCLASGASWNDLAKCQPFFEQFPYIVAVTPNSIARKALVENLRPRLPASCLYVIEDAGFQGCKTLPEYIETHGLDRLPAILCGAVELPAFGILNLADVRQRDLTKVPRTLSRFQRLDQSIGGFFAGELSVWTGKRGIGKSTVLSQLLLEAVDQGHVVCAYSGELDKAQFREWAFLQAAGPKHIGFRDDALTGKHLPSIDSLAEQMISEWLNERFWLFDLEKNTRHDLEAILCQFAYAKMRYGADVFLVDNIMSVDFDIRRDADFNRMQSQFTQELALFCKRQHVHVHLVVHPRKNTSGKNSEVTADDVHGSGDITNRADNVFFLTTHNVTSKSGEPEIRPMIMTLKNRDFGSKINQWLQFDKKSRRFYADGGDPFRPLGWDAAARQMEIQELSGNASSLPF